MWCVLFECFFFCVGTLDRILILSRQFLQFKFFFFFFFFFFFKKIFFFFFFFFFLKKVTLSQQRGPARLNIKYEQFENRHDVDVLDVKESTVGFLLVSIYHIYNVRLFLCRCPLPNYCMLMNSFFFFFFPFFLHIGKSW